MGVTFKLCNEVLTKFYGRPEELKALYKTMCVLNGLLSLTAFVGNVVMLFALKKASSIPSSARILLQCLALTDLAMGVLGHPIYIAVISRVLQHCSCENVHEIPPAFFVLSLLLFPFSFITVTVIGVDRFLAISFHLRYNELVTPKRVVTAVAASWILSLTTTSIGVFYFFKVGEIIVLIFGYIFTLLLCVIYVKLFSIARQHTASINSQAQVAMSLSNITRMARNRNLAIKTFCVFIVFLLCYCPFFFTLTVLLASSQPSVTIQGAVQFTTLLVMLNSSLNPLVFGWKIREVRQIVKNDFRKIILRKSDDTGGRSRQRIPGFYQAPS